MATEHKIKSSDECWFPLRVTYGREMKVKDLLEGLGHKCFVPLVYKVVERNGSKQKKWLPAINNLIFLYISIADLRKLKEDSTLPIRYIMNRQKNAPITIPDKQMEDFIRVAGQEAESGVYIRPDELQLMKGTRVKVVAGPLAGVEGTLMRIKHDRRVVVQVENMIAFGTAFIKMEWLEKIEE